MPVVLYSLEDNNVNVWMFVYVVHFNLQISEKEGTDTFPHARRHSKGNLKPNVFLSKVYKGFVF